MYIHATHDPDASVIPKIFYFFNSQPLQTFFVGSLVAMIDVALSALWSDITAAAGVFMTVAMTG